MQQHRDNYTFLTQGPVYRVIGTMAVPTIVSMLVTSLYNVADTYFVGKISTQAVAAVGIVFSVMFVIQAFSFFFGNGSGNYIARELGAQRHHNAEVMASTGFFYALAAGLVIMVVGLLWLKPLSVWLGSTPTILPYTEKYLGVILLGAPLMTGSLCLNNQMRFQGNASFAMWGIVAGAIVNVGLNPILIFWLDWGITGAALATVFGQLASFVVLLRMTRHGGSIRISFRHFSTSRIYIKEIYCHGLCHWTGTWLPTVLRFQLWRASLWPCAEGFLVYGEDRNLLLADLHRVRMDFLGCYCRVVPQRCRGDSHRHAGLALAVGVAACHVALPDGQHVDADHP